MIFLSSFISQSNVHSYEIGNIHLNLIWNSGGASSSYLLDTINYLEDLGLHITLENLEWHAFMTRLLVTKDYDLVILGIGGGGVSPDMRELYTESGGLNIFGLDISIPYVQESEDMQNEGVTIVDLDQRQQHYYEWQQLMMDKIIPLLPYYTPVSYVATWSNLVGYNSSWGIVDCLPYMHFESLHENQTSILEFNIADAEWKDLNPLLLDDTASSFIFSLIDEPILGWAPEMKPIKNALVKEWSNIDEYHYKFTLRDDIFWNPSYNISLRNDTSPPLDPLTTPLLSGLKDGFVSEGTNQRVTAKDAVFTLLSFGNDIVSQSTTEYDWIEDCYVDPFDEYSFHIHIDGDATTPEQEIYADFWDKLSVDILPEFFLNSTDATVSYTSGGAECTGLYEGIQNTTEWKSYSFSPFGCGKYMLDFHIDGTITVLRASPYWFGKGIIDGTSQILDLDKINIHIIPDISRELSLFKDGFLDWAGLSAFPTDRRVMQKDSRFDVQSLLTASMSFLAFNLQRPFIGGTNNYEYLTLDGKTNYTKGAAIRKAICYAIDRVEMNNQFSEGEFFISDCPIYPFTKYYYHDDIIKYNYNLTLAEEWLSAALDPVPTSSLHPNLIQISVVLFLMCYMIKKRSRKLS